MNPPFVVVYDACILYSAALRDLLVRLAMTELFQAKWTEDIHREWMDAVLKTRRPDVSASRLQRTRELMDASVPNALVSEYASLIDGLRLPDPDDRHVLAAAIASGAQTIVTFNLKDFPPSALAPWGVEAQNPDDFVIGLMDLDSAKVLQAMREQRAALTAPTVSAEHLLETIEKQGMTLTAARLRASIPLI